MIKIILNITFLIVITFSSCYSIDTLKHYENTNSKYMLRDHNVSEYAERFMLNFDGEINGFRLKVNGTKGTEGLIRVYGNEVSDVIPMEQLGIIDEISFKQKVEGEEWISINFDSPIQYKNKQLFISVQFEDSNSNIYTDYNRIKPNCISNNCISLNHQLVRNNDGKWKLLESSFLVELFVTEYDSREDTNFQPFNFTDVEDINFPINSISIYDFDKDGNPDILTNQFLLLNMGQNVFKKSDLIDTNSNCIANIIVNDPIKPRIVSLMKNSDNHYIINYKFSEAGIEAVVDSFAIDYNINELQSYSLKDINNDGYLDIVMAINTDNTSELITLTHNENNKYQKSFSLPLNRISTISFNPLIDYKNQLMVNYISDKMEIYEIDNSGFRLFYKAETSNNLNTDYYITDINNDSRIDLVSVNQNIPSVEIQELEDNEIPKSELKSIYSDDNELYSPVVEDFDNNGYKDILMTTRCDCRKGSVFYQNSDGEFKKNSLLSGFNNISIGPALVKSDLNNDGKIDFISTSNSQLIGFINSTINGNNFIQFEDDKDETNEVIVYTNKDVYVSVAAPNGRSLRVQEPSLFHIGIPENETIDSVRVKSKLGENIYTDVALNKKHQIEGLELNELSNELSDEFYTTPNPFKSNVSIVLNTPDIKNLKTIRIYNQSGEIVFYKEITTQNKIIWNGKDEQGSPVASGVYIATIESDGKVLKNKLLKID